MLRLRRGRAASRKAQPLLPRPLPLSAFAGRWPLHAALDPARVAVFGEAVRERDTPQHALNGRTNARCRARRCIIASSVSVAA